MATLNTLRTRGALFLSIFIGLALLTFLLGDLSGITNVLFNNRNRVGAVDGNHIDYTDFAARNENMNNTVQMLYYGGRGSLSSEQMDQVRNMTWESYIREFAYEPGYRKLGLSVGQEEQRDMIKGTYTSPVITSIFANPQIGAYDLAMVEGLISGMDADPTGRSVALWEYIKGEMINERTMSKYMTLAQNGVWINDLEVNRAVEADNNVYNGRYVTIPFSQIADSLVDVSDSEIRAFYRDHKHLYKQTASRDIEYVVFDLVPSEADYAEAATHIATLAEEFSVAQTPMQFASLNSLTRPDTKYYREEELSPELAAIAFGNRTGEMNGPTLDGDNYTVSRVSDVRMMPDSVGARHILLPATNAAVADSIATAIRGGKSIFELAPSYTMDQTVDLGVFPPDMMVEPFANAVIDARVGQVLVVETQYGTHVVEVTSKTPMVRKAQIATISYSVEPSEVTRQAAYNEAREFLTVAAGSKENFDAAVTQTGASRRVATIASGDRDVRGLTDSRELVQWSFNTKPGTVSAILDIDEDYVVAVLTGAKEPGFTKVTEAAPNIASQLRRDKKAEMLKEQIAGKSFDEVAAMEGAKSGVLENLKVSAFYVPELGVEPAVIGAVENVEAGKVSKPVKGISGIYLVAVDSMEQTGEATFESKKVQMEAMSEGSIMQRVAQSMTEGVEIIDNRSKFF